MTTPPGTGDSTPSASGDSSLPEGWVPPTFTSHPRPRWARVLRWTAAGLSVVVLLGAAFVVGDYFYIKSKITSEPIVRPSGQSAPPKLVTKAENFVLIGSDTRAGANGTGTGGAKISGARSDTTMILHITAGGSGATLISIPRDSYVQIPSCVVTADGQTSAPEMNKFNAAYSIGGEYDNKYAASCTIHTIETLTGLHIDHYAVIDFIGFEHMVEKLGGVKMCVARPLYDPVVHSATNPHGSGLNLPAGRHVQIDGTQALALMRARYNLDGGGDLPRIKRQQQFAGAMIRKASSSSLLLNPLKLQGFLTAAASSLTTDGFGLGTMRKLVNALHEVGAGAVHLLTVPNLSDQPGLPYGDVEWDPNKAPALWAALRKDQPIPGLTSATPTPTASATSTPTPTGPPLTIAPSGISVAVQNGSGQAGLAHTVADQLTAQGYHVVSIGDADKDTYTQTLVKYGSTKVESSQTVAAAFAGSRRVADPTAGSTITVVVGSDFTEVEPVTLTGTTTPTPTATPTIDSISAAKPGCLA